VRAKPNKQLLQELHDKLDSGSISNMRPFGHALQHSLQNARIDPINPDFALWVEEDYCSPPLAMERQAVLDHYFGEISVERVLSEEESWNKIDNYTRLWDAGR